MQIYTISCHDLEQNYLAADTTGKYHWDVLQLPHSVVYMHSWHTAISDHQSKKCTGVAAVCILVHWPEIGLSWHVPSLSCLVADGSEPLYPQNLAYTSPIKLKTEHIYNQSMVIRIQILIRRHFIHISSIFQHKLLFLKMFFLICLTIPWIIIMCNYNMWQPTLHQNSSHLYYI